MTAPTSTGDVGVKSGVAYKAYKDKSKPADVRQSNINAAKGKQIMVK